ncbi:MAG TPA: caspase family protein, partial [Thermoanaerobaculia bacterium]|nr:caspase family protein [Thermoanaerobaculia bacterium]
MERYAIVIGADNYDPKIGKLDSAVRDALDFTTWVTGAGGVPAANLRLLLEPDPAAPPPALPPGVTGFSPVSARKIKEAIVGLRDALPAGGGERLYFYYAGHGASIPEWQEDPVLISPRFVDHDLDDDEVLGFKELFNRLGALTFDEQICLIDACRDFGLPGYEPVVLSGVRPRLAERQARQYVLYSVAPGQKAAESSRGGGIWTRALLDALEGRDYRAVVPGGTARNPFEIRLDHLASRIRSEVEDRTERIDARQVQIPEYARDRQGDNPLLAVFTEQTVPRAKLRVYVDPPLAHRTCQVSVMLYVPGRGELREKASPPPPLRVPVGFELFPLSYSIRAEAELFTVG